MERINLKSTSAIKIEVNDSGDYISINLADRQFPKKFATVFDNIKAVYMATQHKKQDSELDINGNLDEEIESSKAIMAEIDYLFGECTCKKVFGDIVPDMYAFTEFFEQLVPIIRKCGRERNSQIMSKYRPDRKGIR